ncbi:MAG: signal recognition particle-docking protein FtsY [Alphaproteobacteria bacterium]|nr:signal recognition particle-docking protein FtsY [Alphaproteobacteria bacterium]
MSENKEQNTGWFARLKAGLAKSSGKIASGLSALAGRELNDALIDEIEELLITADLGPVPAAKLASGLTRRGFDKTVSGEDLRDALAADITALLDPIARPLEIDPARRPHVVLVVGVNGSGKTTTIGKLARQFRDQGKSVMLAAGDTFRAAAVEQLQIWGERTDCPVIAGKPGADAAGLAYEALEKARAQDMDVLLIDTAGRLHNKTDLMAELEKIIRVIRKQDATAPHDCVLVLDATTGQNALAQVQTFRDLVDVTGLIVTKLDGTARGGVLVALADRFGLPVHAIGVGEKAEDMRPFTARDFAHGLLGIEQD